MRKERWKDITTRGIPAWRYSYNKNTLIREEVYVVVNNNEFSDVVNAWSKETKKKYTVSANEQEVYNGMVWLKEKNVVLAADLLMEYYQNKLKEKKLEAERLLDKIVAINDWSNGVKS